MNFVAFFSNLASGDMIIILIVILLLFGAKRLPELARGLGQAMNEFTKAKDDVQRQIATAVEPPVQTPPAAQAPAATQEPKPVPQDQKPVA
ncbi:MAG: twin-arginine translocase TatA/TatE family subunit [Verrucomicrobiota bacterium]